MTRRSRLAATAATRPPSTGKWLKRSSRAARGVRRAGPLLAAANRRRRGPRSDSVDSSLVIKSWAAKTSARNRSGRCKRSRGSQRTPLPLASDQPSCQSRAGDSTRSVRTMSTSRGRPWQQPSTERLSSTTISTSKLKIASRQARTCSRNHGPASCTGVSTDRVTAEEFRCQADARWEKRCVGLAASSTNRTGCGKTARAGTQ